MGLEEVGTEGLKKKDKKTKEKSKKEAKLTKEKERIVVTSVHKKTKRTSKKSVGNSGFGAENTEQEIFEKSNQQGESVEPFGEGNAFESVEKEEKRKKRKRKKSIEQEIFEKSNQPGESVEAFGEGHALEDAEKEEKGKKKRKKDSSIVSRGDDLNAQSDISKDEKKRKKKKDSSIVSEGDNLNAQSDVSKDEKKRKKKKDSSIVSEGDDLNAQSDVSKDEKKRKKKKDSSIVSECDDLNAQSDVSKDEKKRKKKDDSSIASEGDDVSKDEKKRKKKSKKNNGESSSGADKTMDLEFDGHKNDGTKSKKGKAKSDDVGSKPEKTKKKVSFSGKDEVFQSPEDNLVRGKRFSKEEDELVKEAVFNYIETNCLGEEGLQMVMNCKSYPKIRNCWKDIGTALPHRPQSAVYYRAHILFRRDEKHKWTKEEIDILRASQKKHGNQWRAVADELGKHRVHVKDTWRRIRHANLKKGHWSQDEYQTLFDLVNLDLRMKYAEEKKSKHGMLRDNVPWTAISDRLTTRAEPTCCSKWYSQLTSPMVTAGDWADSDDYRLIDALFELDASCYGDVDWDNLLEHRSGTICQKRWSEMVLHIGEHMNKSFVDQVEVLAKRYCPELLEARENWESKPAVP